MGEDFLPAVRMNELNLVCLEVLLVHMDILYLKFGRQNFRLKVSLSQYFGNTALLSLRLSLPDQKSGASLVFVPL